MEGKEIKVFQFNEELNKFHKGIDIDFYPYFFDKTTANILYKKISKIIFGKVEGLAISKKRRGCLFGDVSKNTEYVIKYRGQVIKKKIFDWNNEPIIKKIKDYLEDFLSAEKVKFDVCVVQLYPTGNNDIKPHRDKEMPDDSLICGISLGATRELVIDPARPSPLKKGVKMQLNSGSLYILYPPTNNSSTHSITADKSIKDPRISLTFRNYSIPI